LIASWYEAIDGTTATRPDRRIGIHNPVALTLLWTTPEAGV